jgi:hypothetical protein
VFGSPECTDALERFLAKKEEHKELEKLQGSHAIHVADSLEKVRNFAMISCAKFVLSRFQVHGHSRMSHTYLSSPAVTLRDVGNITNLLHIPRRGRALE